jgi:hypothetical protein
MPEEATNPGTPLGGLQQMNSGSPSINLSPKNLALAALLFLGGAGGGGLGSGMLGGGLEKEVASLGIVVQELKHSVEIVSVSMVEIKTELKADRRANEKLEAKIEDHEKRIRVLETKRR